MPEFFFAIIDGTGEWNNDAYAKSMATSFCKQIDTALPNNAWYERGPSFEGYRMNERGVRAAEALRLAHDAGAKRLFLAGYSRGAVAAIMAAEALKKAGLPVTGLFLFDPVARHLSEGGSVIPDNVGYVRIARRSFTPAMVKTYDFSINGDIPVIRIVPGADRIFFANPLRTSFGFADVFYQGKGAFTDISFAGSHGALGGVGWRHVTEDADCVKRVATYMQQGLDAFQLPIKLKAPDPVLAPARGWKPLRS